MTTTPAMPELPEPELGHIETDKSRQPAFSARQMRAALQAQPAEVSDEQCKALTALFKDAMDWGRSYGQRINLSSITVADVSEAYSEKARAILALRPQADHPDTARCIKARNNLNAALHGEGALIDDLEHAVANACAKLLRPQAVPMTEDEFVACLVKANCIGVVKMSYDSGPYYVTRPSINASKLKEAVEAHHGITAHGAQEGV